MKKARLWKLSRDNPIGSSVPPCSGEHSVFLNLKEEVDAVDYLEALTTSDILEMIVCEFNCFAMRKMAMSSVLPLLNSAFILAVYW